MTFKEIAAIGRKLSVFLALRFKTPPRTLQRFLESIQWDEEKLRDRCQQIVARDHATPEAIGCRRASIACAWLGTC
jgi:hypothetical protein